MKKKILLVWDISNFMGGVWLTLAAVHILWHDKMLGSYVIFTGAIFVFLRFFHNYLKKHNE